MKKIWVFLFLFLGGVCMQWESTHAVAQNLNGKSSISFEETYIYVPETKPIEASVPIKGYTPTGNPPYRGTQLLPPLNEKNSLWLEISGLTLLLIISTIKQRK